MIIKTKQTYGLSETVFYNSGINKIKILEIHVWNWTYKSKLKKIISHVCVNFNRPKDKKAVGVWRLKKLKQ